MSQTEQLALDVIKSKFPDTFLFNKTSTAELLGNISTATLDRLVKNGAILTKKIGGQVFFKIDDIAEYMAGA